jgi:hypothetical protein
MTKQSGLGGGLSAMVQNLDKFDVIFGPDAMSINSTANTANILPVPLHHILVANGPLPEMEWIS